MKIEQEFKEFAILIFQTLYW